MSLDLTYAENADAVLRNKRRKAPKILVAGVGLLILASQFGYVPKAAAPGPVYPNPIRCPGCTW